MGIIGVKLSKGTIQRVDFGKCELRFLEGADGVEYVQSPAAFFGLKRSERFEFAEGAACVLGGNWPMVVHEKNSRIGRDSIQKNVATNPTGAPCGAGFLHSSADRVKAKSGIKVSDDTVNGLTW